MKGILFKPDMIQAIVEGRKTQTRRLAGLDVVNRSIDKADCPTSSNDYRLIHFDGKIADFARGATTWDELQVSVMYHCKPRYQVGETVYIKEAHCIECFKNDTITDACYKTDEDTLETMEINCDKVKWRSPLFMPEWAARYFINITSVTPQRLQDITPEDCEREGLENPCGYYCDEAVGHVDHQGTINNFAKLWDSINGKTYPWESNPWVWRCCFEVMKKSKCI